MKTTSEDINKAIETERIYQEQKWPNHSHPIGEYILILEKLLGDTKRAWLRGDGSVLHEIRQLTATGVACMEEHGAPLRGDPIVDTTQPQLLA